MAEHTDIEESSLHASPQDGLTDEIDHSGSSKDLQTIIGRPKELEMAMRYDLLPSKAELNYSSSDENDEVQASTLR